MANRNFPSIASMIGSYNYVIKHGQPYFHKGKSAGWTNGDRVIAATRVIGGEDVSTVAREMNCDRKSIRNWVKTLDTNNPRLQG
jgi:hypothetical protein